MNTKNYKFPRDARLLNPRDFSFVFEKAIPAVSPTLTVLARFNDKDCSRLGITVAKKKVKHAVQRNRVKRCIRESFRSNTHKLPNVDIIVVAKHGVDSMDNASIHRQITKLWERLIKRCQ